jgi:ABC-2 type transport system permease protein
MYTLWTLTVANIKMFVRNRQALYFTFFFPIFLMVVLGLINFDRSAKVDVGLVLNAPPTAATKQFIDAVKQVPLFTIHEGIESDERQALVDDKRAVVFVIPPDLLPGPSSINAVVNANQASGAATATNIVSGMLDKTALQISGAANQFTLNREEINSNHLKYIDFLLPGLIGLSVMQLAIFSVAFVFVMFKEKGILKRLVATPMRPSSFVISNVITRLIVTLIQTATFIAIAVIFFDVQVVGSYWLIALIALAGAIMFLGLGFTISGLASTVESVPVFANLVAFPMMFLGGTFFSIDSFPNWLQSFARYLPLTFFSDALRSVMTKGSTFSDVSRDLLWMGIWCVVTIILAQVTFGFEEKRQ